MRWPRYKRAAVNAAVTRDGNHMRSMKSPKCGNLCLPSSASETRRSQSDYGRTRLPWVRSSSAGNVVPALVGTITLFCVIGASGSAPITPSVRRCSKRGKMEMMSPCVAKVAPRKAKQSHSLQCTGVTVRPATQSGDNTTFWTRR